MTHLRPYQARAVAELRRRHAERPVLVAPCGAGKTSIAAEIIRSAVERGNRALFLVHRVELLQQAVARLRGVGLDPFTVQAGQRIRPGGACYVASIQTLVRRDPLRDVRVVIVDECSHARADTWRKAIEPYTGAALLGLTATPYRLDGKGLGSIFGCIVVAATYVELFEAGVLVKPTVFAPPGQISSVRVRRGDYIMSEAAEEMDKLTGDVVEHWHRHAANERTVIYACGIEHAESIAARFGSIATTVHSRIDKDTRAARLDALRRGVVRIVVNCEVLTEGWDLPELGCVSIARPTLSRALHVQMIGRVMRSYPGKTRAVVLDHAGNHDEHGPAWADLKYELDENEPVKGEDPGLKRCPECYALIPRMLMVCPECKHVFEPGDEAAESDEEITESDDTLTVWDEERSAFYRAEQYKILVQTASERGHKLGWARNKYRASFGEWPPRSLKRMERELYRCPSHEWQITEFGGRCARCLIRAPA